MSEIGIKDQCFVSRPLMLLQTILGQAHNILELATTLGELQTRRERYGN